MDRQYRSKEQIDEMRKRLYDRGHEIEKTKRHELSDVQVEVARDWNNTSARTAADTTDLRKATPAAVMETPDPVVAEPLRRRRVYRTIVLLGSLLIFVFVTGISSLYLYFGGNQISSDNINISIEGQPVIGGGEVMSLQVAVSNQNSVPIESATLIMKYPPGTRSTDDNPRNLYEERIPINDITPGEVQNIPVRVAVFGEENDEKSINATIEYRVENSNGMFYKDAAPLAFRIISSPIVLRVDTIEKVASGQVVDVVLTAASNASTPLYDVLVSADYPAGFRYQNASPEPVFGDNVWRIDELLPGESYEVSMTGVITGLTEEGLLLNFSAGPTDPNNQYLVGAALANTSAEFVIERPFIDVGVSIDGERNGTTLVAEGESSSVQIDITNTLDETIYDMAVEVRVVGNAVRDNPFTNPKGFYDSNRGVLRMEVSNNPSFSAVLPGDSRTIEFDVLPNEVRTTASYELEVNVFAQRVAEPDAQESLVGTGLAEAKFSSSISVGSQAGQNVGRFGDSGPIPPIVGETTTYTLTIAAEAGANDMTGAVVETSLPIYVDWLNSYDAPGQVVFNPVSKQLTWDIGDVPSGETQLFTFQVGLLPSSSQVGQIPVLLNRQSMRANDRFTSVLLQDSAPAVTTELSTEMGYEEENGKVTQ